MKTLYDFDALQQNLLQHSGLIVAISGGVDSAVLLTAAVHTLGVDRVAAAIADSASLARAELQDARAIAAGLKVELLELPTREIEDPRYQANSGDRCYWCKEQLFHRATAVADQRGWTLAYGENASDSAADRPGALSAQQRGVVAPLREVGWHKEAVRAYARDVHLVVAEKPAAPCLASRIATGVPVQLGDLERIEAIEIALKQRGYQVLRARHIGANQMVLEFATVELARALAEQQDLIGLVMDHGYQQCSLRAYVRGGVATSTI